MKPRYLFFGSFAVLLSFGCVAKAGTVLESDLSALSLPGGRSNEPTEVWRFVINPYEPQPDGTDDTYTSVTQFELQMDPAEMAVLRYFQGQGVDFISVPDSVISISVKAQEVLTTKCLRRAERKKSMIIIRQTRSNLKKIQELIGLFGNEIAIDRPEME